MAEKKFKPRAGQVDFTHIRWCPVINCILQYKDKILLLYRSDDLRLYPSCWNGVSGFLDDNKSLQDKIYEELREEVGMSKKNVLSYRLGHIFNQEAKIYKKTWIIHPVLVKVNTNKIKLDWEANKYEWISPRDIKKYKLLPGFDRVFETFFD